MNTVLRIVAALALAGVVAYCVFGFIAPWENSEPAKRLPWQTGYGVLGPVCLGGMFLLLRRCRHRAGVAAKLKP
jgi:hypothetical protein